MTKLVNGQRIPVDPADKAAILNEWETAARPTPDDINTERDRRLLAGGVFTVAGYDNPINMTGTETAIQDMLVIERLAEKAHAAGVTDPDIKWRDADNIIHALTPDQFIAFAQTVIAYAMAIKQTAWAIKDNGDIPTDYDNDKHWPVIG
jgi:hypothetical protein